MLTVQSTIIFNPQRICAQRVRVIGSAANLSYSSVFLRKNASSTLRKFLQFVRGKNGAVSEKETGFFICFAFFVSYAYEMYCNFIPCACNLCILVLLDLVTSYFAQKKVLFRGKNSTQIWRREGWREGWRDGVREGQRRDEGGKERRREGGEEGKRGGGRDGWREGGREEGGIEGGMEGGTEEGGGKKEEGVMEGGGEGHTVPGPDLLLHQPSSLMT